MMKQQLSFTGRCGATLFESHQLDSSPLSPLCLPHCRMRKGRALWLNVAWIELWQMILRTRWRPFFAVSLALDGHRNPLVPCARIYIQRFAPGYLKAETFTAPCFLFFTWISLE